MQREANVTAYTRALENVHRRIQASPTPLTSSACRGHGLLAMVSEALHSLSGSEEWRQRANAHLDAGIQSLNNEKVSTSFYRSAPGFGWVLSKVSTRTQFIGAADIVESLAEVYLQALHGNAPISHDLVNGLAGLIVFARATREPMRSRLLDCIWNRLRAAAHSDPNLAWLIKGVHWQGADLGIAHGAPGIIASLAAALIGGWTNDDALESVLAGGAWLRTQRSEFAGIGGYPYKAGDTGIARLGWCYGSSSVAICYAWLTSLDPSYARDVEQSLADSAALRLGEMHEISDACICHGEAGWSYIGRRLSELTGRTQDPSVLASAMSDHQALLMRSDEHAEGAVLHALPSAEPRVFDTLLEGAAGAWLGMAGTTEPNCRLWEGMLLLDFPTLSESLA